MRTNIEIDDDLMCAAMNATGFKTKRETVEEGLRLLAQRKAQTSALEKLWGIGWDGDLDEMRRDKPESRGE